MRVLAPLISLLPAALCAELTVVVPATSALANPSTLPPSTHATLQSSGTPFSAPLTRRNTFEFKDVRPGSYLLTVHCRDYTFEAERVDVTTNDEGGETVAVWQTFRGHEWDNKGENRGSGEGRAVAEVRAMAMKEFYSTRGGFSVLSFLKSPMILMALFSLAVIVGMPYLMENMDPETRAEFEEMQKSNPLSGGGNPAASIQSFDLAGWMAGKSSSEEAQSGNSAKRK